MQALVDGPPNAQEHVEHEWENKFDFSLLEAGREQAHAKDVPPDGQRGYPDVYVNGDDVDAVTVTVDPYKNAQWIRDDSHSHRSAATIHRGALKDHAGVMRAVALVDQHPGPPTTFVPTSTMLNGFDKLTPRCVANSTRGRTPKSGNYGKLPVISKQIWNNALPDVVDWQVEARMWLENTHLSRDRRFDCSGNCR